MDSQQSQGLCVLECVWVKGDVTLSLHGWLVRPEYVQEWGCASTPLWVKALVPNFIWHTPKSLRDGFKSCFIRPPLMAFSWTHFRQDLTYSQLAVYSIAITFGIPFIGLCYSHIGENSGWRPWRGQNYFNYVQWSCSFIAQEIVASKAGTGFATANQLLPSNWFWGQAG